MLVKFAYKCKHKIGNDLSDFGRSIIQGISVSVGKIIEDQVIDYRSSSHQKSDLHIHCVSRELIVIRYTSIHGDINHRYTKCDVKPE